MNSVRRARVEPVMQRHRQPATVWRLGVPLLCLAVHGCTQADGGAVELSWALRSTQEAQAGDALRIRVSDGEVRARVAPNE